MTPHTVVFYEEGSLKTEDLDRLENLGVLLIPVQRHAPRPVLQKFFTKEDNE